MKILKFDLQKFVALETAENGAVLVMGVGETYIYNNVIYTATSEQARINLDSANNVSGVASGTVQATTTNGADPTVITFDTTNGAVNFSATGDETFNLTLANRTFKFSEGNITVTSGGVAMDSARFFVAGTRSAADYEFVVDAPTQFIISSTAFTITSEKMSVIISAGGRQFATQLSGTATRNFANQTFTFTEGTTFSTTLGRYTFSVTSAGELGGGLSFTSKGITFTPADTGALGVSILRDGTPIISNGLSISNGGVFFNTTNNTIGVTAGTVISATAGNYSLSATATGDATTAIALTDDGINFTPNTGDGTLQLTLGSAKGSMTAELEVLRGGFLFGTNGTFSVAKDTELKLKFSDDYSVNLKATDDAGGAISIGENGITFTPNIGDGGLQISVTKNGETRTTSIDMTGTVTYNLDGSISLAKGTVVKNTFENGRTLAITANSDASGAMTFNPLTGLTITPATPDALNVEILTASGAVVNVNDINGSIGYDGGIITLSDGTEANLKADFGGIYVKTTGGSSTIDYADSEKVICKPADGATFIQIFEISGNEYPISFTSGEETMAPGLCYFSAGTTVVGNLPLPFILENAGSYTLNGIKVTTTADNVQVLLGENSIIFDGITYTTLDENAKLTLGDENYFEGGNAVITGTENGDAIHSAGANARIYGQGGNDTIITSGANSTIDAGAGENFVSLSGAMDGEFIALNGQTTVLGFQTGFGEGTDTLYTEGDYPAVDFRENGLTVYDSENSMTFSDINHTAQVNMLYAGQNDFELAVFIANDEWYDVTNGTAKSYVGATATPNHGIDFSGVASDVNVTLNTDYSVLDAGSWIENVHSIRGGSGNTTITGSDKNDTIFAGGGQTSIKAGAGNDYVEGGAGGDTFIYALGDGNDTFTNAGAGDLIFLSDISMSQILSANVGENSVALTLSDGGTINISGTGEIYQLANGSRYSADRENLSFVPNS